MVPGVGSVGDILALIELATTMVKALSKSAGASKEYQDAITELDAFTTTLNSLAARLPAASSGLTRLPPSVENALNHAVSQCRILLEDFRRRIEGYQHLVKQAGMKGGFAASWRRVGWGLFRKEELVALKTKLSQQMNIITVILSHSNR